MTRRPATLVATIVAALLALALGTTAGAATATEAGFGRGVLLEPDSDTAVMVVPVTLSRPSTSPVVVSYYVADDTAVAGTTADYRTAGTPAVPRTITIAAGRVQTTVSVTVNADNVVEPDEQFRIVVTGVSGGDAVPAPSPDGTGTILDSDTLAGAAPVLAVTGGAVREGDSGTRSAQFYVQLSRPLTTTLSFTLATSPGTATAPADYTTRTISASLAASRTSYLFDVVLTPDTLAEADEDFTVTATLAPGSPVTTTATTATFRLLDDDTTGTPTTTTTTPTTTTPTTTTTLPPNTAPVATSGSVTTPELVPVAVTLGASDANGDTLTYTVVTPPTGGTLTGTAPNLTYTPAPGFEGTDTFTWKANDGRTDSNTATTSITVTHVNRSPVAAFTTNTTSGPAPLAVTFDATDSTDPDGTIAAYNWNLGDITTATGVTTTRTYATPGTYTTTLTVTDNTGATNTTTRTITVTSSVSVTPMVAAGNAHTCALSASGTVSCWGTNSSGQLGDGTTTSRAAPTAVTGLPSGITSIAAGDNQTCALTAGGTVWCWGSNVKGQLGNGTTTDSPTPVQVTGVAGAVAVGAGDNHTCAATATTVSCWGWNFFGQLGNGTTADSSVPTQVSLPAGVGATVLSGSYSHTCAVLSTGAAACWGTNSNGQLGNNSTARSLVPVTPVGLTSGVTDIAAGGSHSCAVVSAGARCWGSNSSGQLGNGSTTRSLVPVTPTGLATGTASVVTGGVHSCALTTAGAVRCWGSNQDGQLGVGDPATNPTKLTPTAVVGLTSGQTALASGIQHSCARASTGTIRCWGLNTGGQLGNGGTTSASTPVVVTGT